MRAPRARGPKDGGPAAAGGGRTRGPDDLASLLRHGEGRRVEFKLHLPKPDRFARLVASMANGGGGTILLGVDDSGRPRGLADPKGTLSIAHAIIHEELEPAPPVSHRLVRTEAHDSLLVLFVESAGEPVRLAFADHQNQYVRVNDHNQPVRSLPAHVHEPRARRAGRLDAKTRARFETVASGHTRVTAAAYSKACNISLRAARRDLCALQKAFLVCEVAPGIYEFVGE